MRDRRMPAVGALLAAAVLSGALLTGCSFGWAPPPEICVPELDVQPTLASPGESVEVTTARACPLEPPAGGWLVRVQPEGGQSHWVDGRVQPSSDGSFTIAMMLPPDMPTGPAMASIVNWWEVAECPDNASCAAAEGSFEVVPGLGTCLPYDLSVEPEIAPRGTTLTIRAPSMGCTGDAIEERLRNVTYRVALSEWQSSVPAATVDVPLRADGSLYAELTVPADMEVGPATVGVANYFELAPCPPNADCAGPVALLQVSD